MKTPSINGKKPMLKKSKSNQIYANFHIRRQLQFYSDYEEKLQRQN